MYRHLATETEKMNMLVIKSYWRSLINKIVMVAAVSILALPAADMFPGYASAHSLFIQSGRHHVSEGKASPLFFCYGHHFPVDEAIRREKLSYVRVIAPDKTVEEVSLRDDRSLHSYLIEYKKPGTYVLTAKTNPGYFAIYFDKEERRRHSLKPMSAFADNAAQIVKSMKSSQWAKTYVFCAKTSDPFPKCVGLPLELVPATDVSALKPGDSLEIHVYKDGKPYEGEGWWDATYGGYSTEAEDMCIRLTACKNGKFVVPLSVGGKWFIRYFTKKPASEADKKDFLTEKRTATLVFEVRNARKNPKSDSH